ncbi:unnamed protein product [Clonostachys rosea f. rosea IK726]|uniref:Uncharacterized protein n=1 Tax=Clonostachys rosea f. rosea IK726 TaxID=1349383 RepID=A0ACA9U7F6_BIOOC|nr:unnamed protein product [Clonostachys rosea f. rosea IK726]
MVQLEPEARNNFHAVVIMLTLSGIAVFLRIAVRFSQRQKPDLPDYLVVASLLLFGGYGATILHHIFNVSSIGAFEGMPMKTNSIPIWERQEFMKMVFADEIIFCVIITLIKTSLLIFYWNIFYVSTLQRNTIIVTATACLIWFLVFLCLTIFQCHPVQYIWEKLNQKEYCISSPPILLSMEITNLFLDIIVLAIPTSIISQLRLSTPKKVSVLGIFLVGLGVCAASIARITAIWRPPNVLYNIDTPQTILWSTLQIGMAIICACLPTLGPLLRCSAARAKSWSGSGNIIRSASMKISDMENPNFRERAVDQDSHGFYGVGRTWSVRGDNDPEQASTDSKIELHELVPPRRIRVQKDILVH